MATLSTIVNGDLTKSMKVNQLKGLLEITNLGSAPQHIGGWVLINISHGGATFIFPSYVLAPGKSIRVYTSEIRPDWGGFSFESRKGIWHDRDRFTAALYDAQEQLVSEYNS